MVTETATLYGVPHSLYTGRARSYLLKAGVPFREQTPTTQHFAEVVVPAAGGRRGLPTLELADGTVIRDGAAIMDHFEAATGHRFSPTTPKQRVISRLFDVIGAEGLLRPAMHYRWNFPEANLDFLNFHFRLIFPPGPRQAELAERAADAMRDATRAFGVAPDNEALVEALYVDVVDALEAHFVEHPYLLGGRPCIGDFGMIAPLFAHLGRDPAPLALMQARAPALYRWVERMNRPFGDCGEFAAAGAGEAWLADDAIPETLVAALRTLAEDFVPETLAAAATIDQWIAAQPELLPGTTAERAVGLARFEVRGTQIAAIAQPYRFHLLARFQAEYDALEGSARAEMDALLDACAMRELVGARLGRAIGRDNNLEVWL